MHLGADRASGRRARPGARAPTGVVSEGLNELDERATAEIRSCRCGPKVIAHGIFNGPAPRATSSTAPSAEPPSGGTPFSLAFRVTGALPPGFSRTQWGFGSSSEPAATRSCGRGRAGSGSRRCGRPAAARSASRRPRRGRTRTRPGRRVISPAALSPRSTSPAPCAGDALVPDRACLAGQQAAQVERAQARAHLGQHGRGASDNGGGGARAVDGAVARRAVVVGARLGGRERDARRGQVGLDACRRRRAHARRTARSRPRCRCARPAAGRSRRPGAGAARIAASAACATRSGTLTTGMFTASSTPSPPAGSCVP